MEFEVTKTRASAHDAKLVSQGTNHMLQRALQTKKYAHVNNNRWGKNQQQQKFERSKKPVATQDMIQYWVVCEHVRSCGRDDAIQTKVCGVPKGPQLVCAVVKANTLVQLRKQPHGRVVAVTTKGEHDVSDKTFELQFDEIGTSHLSKQVRVGGKNEEREGTDGDDDNASNTSSHKPVHPMEQAKVIA